MQNLYTHHTESLQNMILKRLLLSPSSWLSPGLRHFSKETTFLELPPQVNAGLFFCWGSFTSFFDGALLRSGMLSSYHNLPHIIFKTLVLPSRLGRFFRFSLSLFQFLKAKTGLSIYRSPSPSPFLSLPFLSDFFF